MTQWWRTCFLLWLLWVLSDMGPEAQTRRAISQPVPVYDEATRTMAINLSIADAYFFEELGARASEFMHSRSEEYKRSPVGSWSSSSSSMSAAELFNRISRDGVQTVLLPTKHDFQSSLSRLRKRISRRISVPQARLAIEEFDDDIVPWSMSKLTEKYGMSAGLLFTDAAHILLDASSESTSLPLRRSISLPMPIARALSLP